MILNNDLVIICLTSTVCFTIGYFYISKFWNSTPIQTPNSPQTFNFSHDQIKEINDLLERGGVLNQETQDLLDQDLQTMMREDLYNEMQGELQQIENQFTQELQDLLNNELLNIHCPLELIDITNLISHCPLELIDITNLISHLYFWF
jgi:hypothetical protein